jgi:BirA family biotin operon repressor/biotin-[acetyl-CoA-carboxylase] ligase
MDESRRLAARGEPHGTVLCAGLQEAGRGRRSRSWIAAAGESLLFTILLRYPSFSTQPRAITLKAGLALSQAVEDFAPPLSGRVRVKWPNDLMIDSRKAAGILTEGDGEIVYIGMGVNVAQTVFPEAFRAKATSLALALGVCCASRVKPQKIADQAIFYPTNSENSPENRDFLRHQAQKIHKCNRLLGNPPACGAECRFLLLEKILSRLYRELALPETGDWRKRLEDRLYRKGCPVRFFPGRADSGRLVEGTLEGIGPDGDLLITPPGAPGPESFITGELDVYTAFPE